MSRWTGAARELDGAEVDALQDLGDEIATLAAHVHAATHRMLTLIVEFDRRRGWEVDGHASCAHWLAFRIGTDLGAAREKVRAARALERLPQISAAMARGELSFAKVRCLSRVASAESESELLAFARTNTAAQLERLVRGYRQRSRLDEAECERIRHRSRCFSVFPDDDGMSIVRGRLDPEVGALLMRAIEAASDALFRPETAQEIEPAQRRADAVGLLAERALAAGFGRDVRVQENEASADSQVAGTTHERGADGAVLDVGRRTRTIPPALRRALEVRDRGCRFPGCGLRFTDAHHIIHWADGGRTSLSNTVLLCRHHHRLVHEEGFRVEWLSGKRPTFYNARGLPVPDAPPALRLAQAAEALMRDNRRRGIEPDWRTSAARYWREQDIPWPLIVRTIAALEASVGDDERAPAREQTAA